MGIKRVALTGKHGESEAFLLRVGHLFVNRTTLRSALGRLVNATFAARDQAWWGEGTACASDAKKFGSCSSNFMTGWHQRYRGPGVMIYWRVEKKSLCVYSRLKSCSASEVAAMIEGVLRHCTDVEDRPAVHRRGQRAEAAHRRRPVCNVPAGLASREPIRPVRARHELPARPGPRGVSARPTRRAVCGGREASSRRYGRIGTMRAKDETHELLTGSEVNPCPKDPMPSHSCSGCRQQEAAAFVVGEPAEDPGPGESEQAVHIGGGFPDSHAAVSGDSGQV